MGLAAELDLDVLRIDSLVSGGASISLENDEKTDSPWIFFIPSHGVEAYVNKYFFIHWIVVVQCFLVKPFYVHIQILPSISSSSIELLRGDLSFGMEELRAEHRHEVLPIMHLT